MHRSLAMLAATLVFAPPLVAQEFPPPPQPLSQNSVTLTPLQAYYSGGRWSGLAAPVPPDGRFWDIPSGLIFVREGNRSTLSVGGALLPGRVKIVTQTPEGPQVTKFKIPSLFQGPHSILVSDLANSTNIPGFIQVEVPDAFALVFIDGELVRARGMSRRLESPPVPVGKVYPVRIRAAYVSEGKFLVEDRVIVIRPGETVAAAFDGRHAQAFPLPQKNARLP